MTLQKRFLFLMLMLCIASLYFPTNRLTTSGYNLKIALDASIPVVPFFAIPYLLFIPFWVTAFLFATWKMDDRLFRALMIGSIASATIAMLTFALFPTYTDRPTINTSGWTANLLSLLYSQDHAFNAFPSLHVLYTTLIALFGSTWRPNWRYFFNGSVVLVIITTLLTGQHHLLDLPGGLVLAWGGYHFGLWVEFGVDGMRRLRLSQAMSFRISPAMKSFFRNFARRTGVAR